MESAAGVPRLSDRAGLIFTGSLLSFLLLFSLAASAQEKDQSRPVSFESTTGSACVVKEHTAAGTMPAFQVQLSLNYKDGTTWTTTEAIIPIDYHLAKGVRERWQEGVKARNKARKVCDEWDLEVAVEVDRLNKEKAQNTLRTSFRSQ